MSSVSALATQGLYGVGHWNYKAPSTPELDSIIQSLSAMNHYVYVVVETASHIGLDLLLVKQRLAEEFGVERNRMHSRYMNAKKYIESGKYYRPYTHDVPTSFEEFKEKHFAHCKSKLEEVGTITDFRNAVYFEVEELLSKGVRFKDIVEKLSKERETTPSSIRDAFNSAVDYYIGLGNSPHSRHYEGNLFELHTAVSAGVSQQSPVKPNIELIVKQITSGTAQPSQGIITEEEKPTDLADVVAGVIAERDKYKADAVRYRSEAENFEAEAEHFRTAHEKLSAEMDKLKTVLANAGYTHLVK